MIRFVDDRGASIMTVRDVDGLQQTRNHLRLAAREITCSTDSSGPQLTSYSSVREKMHSMRRYFEIYGIMLRNSLIREMSFKANFVLWLLVEVLWFLRSDFFLRHHFWPGRSHRGLDEMGSGIARRHASDDRATFPGVLFRQSVEHPGARAHRKARFASRPAARQPVRGLDQAIQSR